MSGRYIMTIGRSFGSRGAEIGRKLAERLDIPFYDKEIIDEQVKKSGFTKTDSLVPEDWGREELVIVNKWIRAEFRDIEINL